MTNFYHHILQTPVAEDQSGAVIAIGNFDGVHRGHQVVLEEALAIARRQNRACFALSFEPHPRTLFKPESPVFRLTDEGMKARVLEAYGVNGLLTLPFTRDVAATTAEDFVRTILLNRAQASHIVSGFNFHFGKNRSGSPTYMQQAGQELGFGVSIVEAKTGGGDGDGNGGDGASGGEAQVETAAEPISSSRIRRLLGDGNVDAAAKLLGYRWLVSGEVIKGAQLGRTLDYPTANISLAENCHLAHGIYAVRFRCGDGRLCDGVASYGRRPTFDNGPALLETFIFDFDEDIYGQTVSVTLMDYLRAEEKFDTVEALVAQMDRDSARARTLLANMQPISSLDEKLSFAPVKVGEG
ncbi:MAG: bifunctional riboflavin kinase/FAD synthetase [Rhizobiaceae bacterium]